MVVSTSEAASGAAEAPLTPKPGRRTLRTGRGTYELSHVGLWKERDDPPASAAILPAGGTITFLGSCFADYAAQYMERRGYRAHTNPSGKLYNPQAVELELRHTLAGEAWAADAALEVGDGRWGHRFRKGLFAGSRAGLIELDEAVTQRMRAALTKADVVVVIVGTTTEMWREAGSGMLTNEIPEPSLFDEDRWYVDAGNAEDARRSISGIQEVLRQGCDARILLAVCPIPLYATWTDQPILDANGRTKAILRVAVDEAIDPDVGYCPLWDWTQGQFGRRSFVIRDGRHFSYRGSDELMRRVELAICERRGRLGIAHRGRSLLADLRLGLRTRARALGRRP